MEPPLEHHRRHQRSFLDIKDDPERPRTIAHLWCLECDYEVEVWQEKLGKKTEKVSIKPKEETKVSWELGK